MKALDALKKAIKIDPNNPVLFQLCGLCASRIATALVDSESKQEKEQWLADAEVYYKKAILLDPMYVDAGGSIGPISNSGFYHHLIFEKEIMS